MLKTEACCFNLRDNCFSSCLYLKKFVWILQIEVARLNAELVYLQDLVRNLKCLFFGCHPASTIRICLAVHAMVIFFFGFFNFRNTIPIVYKLENF